MNPVWLHPASLGHCSKIASLRVASAEIIKIEHPTRGDDTRAWGPPYAIYTEGSGKKGLGEAAYFLSVCDTDASRDPAIDRSR